MLPEAFTKRMKTLLAEEYGAFLDSFSRPRAVALRLNPLKTQRVPQRVPKNKKQKTSPFGLVFLCLKNRKTACKGGFLTYTVLRGSDCSILDLLVNDADDRQHHGSGSDADMLQIVVDAMRLSRSAVSLVHRGNAVHECVHGRGRNDGTCPFLKLIFGHTAANYQ